MYESRTLSAGTKQFWIAKNGHKTNPFCMIKLVFYVRVQALNFLFVDFGSKFVKTMMIS